MPLAWPESGQDLQLDPSEILAGPNSLEKAGQEIQGGWGSGVVRLQFSCIGEVQQQ